MNELKKIFLTNIVKWASLMLGMIMILWVTYALSFPSSTPSWQTAWWVFATVLNKIVSNGDYKTSDWTVANSDKIDWLHASDLSATTTVWTTDMFVAYWSTVCPTWWTKAYDWILEALWNNWAQSNMNLQWNIWAQAAMSTVCAWLERSNFPNLEYAHSYYWYRPVSNSDNYTKTMSCAVCVR